jgi:hypothetical protein
MNPPPPAAKVKADRAEADDAKPADPARQAG